VRVVFKSLSDLYTTRLHRRLFTLKYGGSYLNKILFIHVGISVKRVLLLILVYNLMFLSEYVIYYIQDEYKVHQKLKSHVPLNKSVLCLSYKMLVLLR